MTEARSTTLPKNRLLILTIGGAAVFWATTVATSLLQLAAEYRAAYINWKVQTVWVDSLFAGLIIAFAVSYFLLRSLSKIPAKDAIRESVKLGFVALVIVTILVDVPRSLLASGPCVVLVLLLGRPDVQHSALSAAGICHWLSLQQTVHVTLNLGCSQTLSHYPRAHQRRKNEFNQ